MSIEASSAFTELVRDLIRSGKPSLPWCIAYADDGDLNAALERAWLGCDDPAAMLYWASRWEHRASLVRALCACVRTVLHVAPTSERRPEHAVRLAEEWVRGAINPAACRRALDEAEALFSDAMGTAEREFHAGHFARARDCECLAMVARAAATAANATVIGDESDLLETFRVGIDASVAALASRVSTDPDGATVDAARARIAGVIRGTLRAPPSIAVFVPTQP